MRIASDYLVMVSTILSLASPSMLIGAPPFLTLPLTEVSKQLNQVVLADATSAQFANRVTAIRFDFDDSGGNHEWTCYSEIDVMGAPVSASPPIKRKE